MLCTPATSECPSVDASNSLDAWPLVSAWVNAQRKQGKSADDVMEALGLHLLAADQDKKTRWTLVALAASQLRARAAPRERLFPDVGSLERAVDLLRNCSRVLVISGAGASKSVPGFEEHWASLSAPARSGLPDATGLFELSQFMYSPLPFLNFARSLMTGGHTPSDAHLFIRELERRSKLVRNYSQNVDALEATAGIERVVHTYGSVGTAACVACRSSVSGARATSQALLSLPPPPPPPPQLSRLLARTHRPRA